MNTVLLVDDNPANLGVLIEVLRTAGYRLLVAEDGERALHQMKRAEPDIVLLDVMMPGIDGFETCRRIKAEPRWSDLPVIFMTARDDIVDKVAGFSAGAVDYITKPLQPEEVVARVRTHLRLRELQRELEEKNAELAERNERLAAAVKLRRAAEQALADSLDRAVVVIDSAGNVVFWTKQAARLLGEHVAADDPAATLTRLRQRGTEGPLRIAALPGYTGRDFEILQLEPTRRPPQPADLEKLGLTPREAEVLFWIASGKSNPEIAVILDSSINTIKRHSQSVFDKLHVENRTAAALKATEILEA